MKSPRYLSGVWIVFLLGACSLIAWNTAARINRLQYLAAIGSADEDHTATITGSDPGNIEVTPGNSLLLPNQLEASYHWLAQTQRMLNRGEARVRHIDYENAPFGRAVLTPSPYRWWLGFVAWCEHLITGAPTSMLVEKAALWADPILLVVILAGFAILTANYFGSLSASFLSVGLVSFFPFTTGFLPGAPDDRGLAQALAIASVLLLSICIVTPPMNEKARRRWFILAGIAGGLGLWVKVPVQLPVLWGILIGGLLVSFLTSRSTSPETAPPPLLPWRAWAFAGAATTCIAALIEYSPSQLGTCELSFVHPLHGLAWLGAGELLAQASTWFQNRTFDRSPKNVVLISLSVAVVVVVPSALLKRHGADLFVIDGMGSHLTRLPEGIVAQNFATWIVRQGTSVWLFLTLLPLGLLLPAVWVLTNRQIARSTRAAAAITLGPVLVAFAFACTKLSWWQTLDALLLVTLATVVPGISSPLLAKARTRWISVTLALFVPGVLYVLAWDRPAKGNALNSAEIKGLILRDLAGWISQHSDPGTVSVLSPPSASTALCYYGGFRGIGSLCEENKDGMVAAVRIMSAHNVQETEELVNHRKITHIVLLSWDTFFEDSARAAAGRIEGTFRDQLKFTTLPHWLRPLAYPLPSIPGFEDQSVTVFEVVEEQDEATVLGNIALYFVERGDLDQARSAAAGLRRFSIDFGAWVVRAQVAAAAGDNAELAEAMKALQSRLAARVQPLMAWNRRVDLAVVLARAKVDALAKKQLELCIADLDEANIRSLSPGSVYRLLVLCRGLGVTVPPKQADLALSLVPSTLRVRLK